MISSLTLLLPARGDHLPSSFVYVAKVLSHLIDKVAWNWRCTKRDQETKPENFADDTTIFSGNLKSLPESKSFWNYMKKLPAQKQFFQKAEHYGSGHMKVDW